ncbi:MAG TPA: NrfD/PsrC family molybdoenzyme membrane anchor subunit [Tepidisphaeraceae bacterium]|nr:NrfD/PsrC family molybdoenzyme membrane anchor subunit [Tepidisphaeraceae bacterium]
MQHRADPNRVTLEQLGMSAAAAGEVPAAPASRPPAAPAAATGPPTPYAQDPGKEHSYYNVSMLKSPPWKWEIASYFFLGGMSAGAYTIGRLADRCGGKQCRDIARAAAYLSLASFLPCPPLLIHDLGDPKRFHHMLRVFKPTSPMSMGTWAIIGYSGMSAAEAFRQWMLDHFPEENRGFVLRNITRGIELVHDAAGVPLALMVAGYTGVLLSSTSNPLWSKNKWIGPVFSASAMATGAAGTSLFMSLFSPDSSDRSLRSLEKVDTLAHIAEAICLAGYFRQAGAKAHALRQGQMKTHMQVSIGSLILSELLKLIPFRGRARRTLGMISSILSLVSGFSLRWAMVYGGHEAANDPRTAPNGEQAQTRQSLRSQRALE